MTWVQKDLGQRGLRERVSSESYSHMRARTVHIPGKSAGAGGVKWFGGRAVLELALGWLWRDLGRREGWVGLDFAYSDA